jgi:hypothetical protein
MQSVCHSILAKTPLGTDLADKNFGRVSEHAARTKEV